MPYNADKQEKEILEFWNKNKIFEKSVDERPADKPYVFYDGPPFATGLPHYGHILGSVAKDVVPRYWTMKGYRVERRWGWDCHGLPIERLVEQDLGISGKKEIEDTIGVPAFNKKCRETVLKYTGEWKKMVERMGRWVEFDNSYKTLDTTYMESVWWALKTIFDRGLIYEGRKVLMYCPRCETPVSKAEVAMDNSYKDVSEEAVTVKFKLRNPKSETNSKFKIQNDVDTYILAWTTTPWTLPGNVALAVGEEVEYSLVKCCGAHYLLAKDLVMHHFDGKEFELLRQLRGSDLVGREYEPLYDMPAMRAASVGSAQGGGTVYTIAAADFVTTAEGTGIVHTAVMYGEDDYQLGRAIGLPQVPMLDSKGHYNDVVPEFLQGLYIKKAEKLIKKDLEERGLLFQKKSHTHSYPHCWRCETPLIYNAVSSWFIDIQKIKDRMIELNEKISWYPDHLKHGRFLNIVKDAPDWNISRNRYWATALPFWKSEDGDLLCVGSIDELEKLSGVRVTDLHKDVVDEVLIKKDGKTYTRVPEVLDSWVEAASMPYAPWHYPFENKNEFEARYPGQYIAEYIAQTRTWFYYMHAMATLLFDDVSFEHVVTTGTIVNDKGEKLSKAKRNFTDPWVIIEQYGMDALRYYLMSGVVMQAENLYFVDREVRDTYNKVVNILWNVVSFYEMFATTDTSDTDSTYKKSENVLDRWIVVRLHELVREVTKQMDMYNTVKATRVIKDFIDDLSTWYVRRSRDRFKGRAEEDKQNALATLREVLLTLSKVMAPFTPFIAEKIYLQLTTNNDQRTESVHLEMWPDTDEKLIDEALLKDMETARKVVEMGHALRKEAGVAVRQPLAELRIKNYELRNDLLSVVADELNVKKVENIQEVQGDSWIRKEDGEIKVALNTEITAELKKEGLVREIVRAINNIRKEKKLTREIQIVVSYEVEDELLKCVFEDFNDELKQSVLADKIAEGPGGDTVEIDGNRLKFKIEIAQ